MLMRKLPIIRLDQTCNDPSTSKLSYSSWEDPSSTTTTTSTCSSTLSSIDNLMSARSILKDLKHRRINGYQRIEEEYSMTDSTNLSSSFEATTTSLSSSSISCNRTKSGQSYNGAAKMSITQQGYYSPFEQPKSVNDYVIAPNAFAEPMACLASTSTNSVSVSPTRNSFFERIRDVFRPRSGSKSSTTSSDNNQQMAALNGGIIEDLGEHWIHIMYYEYSEKVGETYKSSATEIGITGFCDSSNNFRLNLGSIAKPNRNPSIRYVRENIREGVRFYNRNGDVFIDCLSNSPIFIQAPLCSHVMGHHLATVYRVEPGHSMQIFSARKFDYLIFEAQKRGPDAIAALQQICCCRLSFLKGWGENYQIQTVLEVPVWIEVLFIGALHELDLLIMQAKNSRHQHLLLQAAQQDIDDLSSCPSMSIS